ncbi:hypothetical protein LOK74_00335 [Brevibacillus humidisoli]|uniref:hypothetical protein n=1 Tax=Brevibacillus humidisoli TaxID=2895522 RepID=UPI001E38C7B6|nr:hypothetical protein [Brevibacillus humidisoli]UFJ41047.1 hypothetical protein LOK74_00335 [Brevibacillus humidisoli]
MLELALIVYYLLVCLYLVWLFRKRDGARGGLAAITCLIPLAGLPLVLIAGRSERKARESDPERFAELTEIIPMLDLPDKVDLAKESAIVPLEEVLVVNDFQTRRRIILDALKEDSLELVPFLAKAVRNEDTETSHYAVTAMVEMKRTMMTQLQRCSVAYEQNPDDLTVLSEYANTLQRYLNSRLMDAETERTYRFLQADVLDRLCKQPGCEEERWAEKIECELMLHRYDLAEKACERFLEMHPDSELSYVMTLKLYYTLRAGNKFVRMMEQLKQSPVKVSHDTLQLIRYWDQGVQNAR